MASVALGTATAAVRCPPGAVPADAGWRLIALASAPTSVKNALAPGVWVDTAGAEPSGPCEIGFALAGTVPTNATIVHLDAAGGSTIVATQRLEAGDRTVLWAPVDGFTGFTVTTAGAKALGAAGDKATNAKRKQPKPPKSTKSIEVKGTFVDTYESYRFIYTLTLSMSAAQGSWTFRGTAKLSFKTEVDESFDGPLTGDYKLTGEMTDSKAILEFPDSEMLAALVGNPTPEPQVASGYLIGPGKGALSAKIAGPGGLSGSTKLDTSGDVMLDIKAVIVGDVVTVTIQNKLTFKGKLQTK